MKVPPNIGDGVNVSRNVDQLLVVVRVSFHEATLDQVLDTLLDHLHVGLEEPDVLDDAAYEQVHRGSLQGLHVTYGHRIDDMLPLHSHSLVDRSHDTVLRLVLDHLLRRQLRDEVLLERVGLELGVHVDLLIRIIEVWLATRFLQLFLL